MNKSHTVTLAAAFWVLLPSLAGCVASSPPKSTDVSVYNVASIKYLSDGTLYRYKHKTYKVVPIKGAVYDLATQSEMQLIETALSSLGWEKSEKPEMTIFYARHYLGSSAVEHRLPYEIRGQTGISSSQTTGQILYGGSISTTTTYTPSYGVVGMGELKLSSSIYSHGLTMEAYDSASLIISNGYRQLWKASLTLTGEITDNDLALKGMLMLAKDVVGLSFPLDTTKQISKKEILQASLMEESGDKRATDKRIQEMAKELGRGRPSAYENRPGLDVVKSIGDWTFYCQRNNDVAVGCGISQAGLAIFITDKLHEAYVIVGGESYLKSQTKVCIEIDSREICRQTPDANNGGVIVRGLNIGPDAYWLLEKANNVTVKFVSEDKQNLSTVTIDMKNYPLALQELKNH
ncbi:MAG: hypothetical protein AABY73_03515 [Pseudomonadota bacterium]